MSQDQYSRSLEGTWEKLSQVAVKGAQYDSPERHPHPKCLAGTRVNLLDHIHTLLDKREKSQLIWLHGTAGVGKSAVAFTVAERMRDLKVTEETTVEKRLAGTFFFSRKHTKRCTTGYFFATLVYQLASNFPSIRSDVKRAIYDNPALLDSSTPLRDQMEAFFLRPLRRLKSRLSGCPPLTFVVDALDECTSEPELIDLILSLARVLREPDLPVTHILLTSRSESHICKALQKKEVWSLVCEIPVKISGDGVATIISLDGADVDNDICIFLQHSFGELESRHPDFPQPSRDQLERLASRAGRRFIVASTMINFIDDEANDPNDRLQLMLELTSDLLPGTEVYKLYDCILSTCANPKRAYLHLSVVAALADPLPMSQISKLLGAGQGRDAETALMQLRSLMSIPTDNTLPVNIYHLSVRDYVSDPSNCSLPQVHDILSPHSLLAHSSLHLMMKEIPESTALLDALSELQSQSQAMQPQDPQRLKDSLAFLVRSPEPLSVLICTLWLRGDHSSDLQFWLATLDGHAWLQTQGGGDWLGTEGGGDWLGTEGGRDWLGTEGGADWLGTKGGADWLQTEGVRTKGVADWLRTKGGADWLQTEGVRTKGVADWLRTKGGKDWLWTEGGKDWLRTEGGKDWLRTEGGKDWLRTEGGKDWLRTEGGKDWLRTEAGADWLRTEAGADWLRTEAGADWLRTEAGADWLRTRGREDWLRTKAGADWLQAEAGTEWLQAEAGTEWLQTRGKGWLGTQGGEDWLQTRGGKGWLGTQGGEGWLQTRGGEDWLGTQGGEDWLTQEGEDWLQTRGGKGWLRTEGGEDWLQTQGGEDWLQTRGGEDWLRTQGGEDWLQTQGGKDRLREKHWFQTLKRLPPYQSSPTSPQASSPPPLSRAELMQTRWDESWLHIHGVRDLQTLDGQDWLQTQAGQHWLQIQAGRHWLQTQAGQKWLQTRAGREWLQTGCGEFWWLTPHGRCWLQTPGGKDWLKSQGGCDWLQTQGGQDWLQILGGKDWLQTQDGRDWLQTEGGRSWLQTRGGRGWLQILGGEDWLRTRGGEHWLQTQDGRTWLQTQGGRTWLQMPGGRDWLQTPGGRDWLQMPHGQAWRLTTLWVTVEEFSSTFEAIREYIIVPELHSQPAFQVIQQFKSLPDFLMFPAFLALRHQDHSTSTSTQGHFPPDMEIIHAIKAFSSFAYEARERSQSASDTLNYACQNWAVHLSRAPNPWDEKLTHTFQSFWNRNLLSWLERQWCLKDLRSCLTILSEGATLAKEHDLYTPGSSL